MSKLKAIVLNNKTGCAKVCDYELSYKHNIIRADGKLFKSNGRRLWECAWNAKTNRWKKGGDHSAVTFVMHND